MGPVKTQFGYYVFKVTKITPASQQSPAQATETIKNLLRSQRQQKALDEFVKDFREDYRTKTDCADDYQVAECKNAPKDETDTGAASGGTPQARPAAPQVSRRSADRRRRPRRRRSARSSPPARRGGR